MKQLCKTIAAEETDISFEISKPKNIGYERKILEQHSIIRINRIFKKKKNCP